ncbi:MAG: fasciclin domain-containing protein [Prevotella sp.]|nr:fasciclin domain-containing protein [Prevotella sp.]
MITNIKKHIAKCSLCCSAAAALALAACADWNDHYDADTSLLDTQHATLWQNILQNENLSQFASLLKKAGYDEVLNATQTYTVWAPVNGTFDYETLASLSSDRLVKEFVENHIARNNYPASGAVDQRVYTLNEKLMLFSGAGSYVIQGIGIDKANVATGNGTIHTLKGKIPFVQNIYESLNNYEYPIDSISAYIHSYDVRKLNEQKSVQGPTLNGEITYLDSIFDEHNDLFLRYFAYINREDSNYSMIVPTNEAWNRAKATISKYFHYVPSFEFMENTSTTERKKVDVKIRDVKYLQDSIVNQMLTAGLFFNNNMYDNRQLDAPDAATNFHCDSLYSTLTVKLYSEDASRLLENTRRIAKSNGWVWLTDDSLRMRTWTVWNPELRIEAENRAVIASAVNVANENEPQRIYVTPGTQNPEVTGHLSSNAYLDVQPISQSTNPGVVFYFPEIRSTTYSIYVVTVPANITNPRNATKPYRFSATMGFADASGKNQDGDRSWVAESAFVSDSAQVDTIYLGDFTFPISYYGTGDYYPYLRINSAVTSRERANYDRNLRIDCLILRPKELDDYLKLHPDYKYDKGIY